METGLSRRSKLIAFWVLAILAIGLVAHFFEILSPFLWAMITAYLFHPLIHALTRRTHLPRRLVAILIYFATVTTLVLGVLTLVPILRQQALELYNQLPNNVETGIAYFDQRFPDLADRFGLDPAALQKQVNDLFTQITASAPRTALTVAQRIVSFLLELFVYLIATFFFFVHGDRFSGTVRKSLSSRYHHEFDRVLSEINSTLGAYLRGQLLLVVIMSTLTYIVLSIYDVRYAVALAITTGVLELIPIIGPWTAGAIAVSVAALDPTPPFGWSHTTLAIVVAITYFVLRQMEDVLVIPTLIGRIVHIHPLVLIFVLLIGTSLGGILGLLLAVPFAAVLRILLSYLYGKMTTEPERRVIVIGNHEELLRARDALPGLTNAQVVLLIQADVARWEDLPIALVVGHLATQHGIDLSVVAADPIAGSLFTAAGLPTTTVAAKQGDGQGHDDQATQTLSALAGARRDA
jgi:predicted PurR-regulated permease PerM